MTELMPKEIQRAIDAMRECDRDRLRLAGDGRTTVDPISYAIETACDGLMVFALDHTRATPAPSPSREGWPTRERLEELFNESMVDDEDLVDGEYRAILRMALSDPLPVAGEGQ